jgi:uncharacterized protein YggT (Ycf19 family)
MDSPLLLFGLLALAIDAYSALIIGAVLLSWFTFAGQAHPSVYRVQELLGRLTDPFLAPIRHLLMPITAQIHVDFSPLLGLLLLRFLRGLLPG